MKIIRICSLSLLLCSPTGLRAAAASTFDPEITYTVKKKFYSESGNASAQIFISTHDRTHAGAISILKNGRPQYAYASYPAVKDPRHWDIKLVTGTGLLPNVQKALEYAKGSSTPVEVWNLLKWFFIAYDSFKKINYARLMNDEKNAKEILPAFWNEKRCPTFSDLLKHISKQVDDEFTGILDFHSETYGD